MKLYFQMFKMSLLVLAVHSANGQGTMVFHSGANDPTTEGFNLNLANASVGPVMNDLGMNAWVTAVPSNGAYATYNETFPSSLAGQDWVLNLDLKVVEVDPKAMSLVVFGSGSDEFYMFFGSKTNGDPFVNIGSQSYTLNGAGSTYNYYQLLYNAPSNTADLYVNGVDQISDVTHSDYSGSGVLTFGSGLQAGPAQVNWNLISLTVPEPSTAALLLLGSGVLLFVRHHKRSRL